jgi:uncharacterized damage-inducible protein DinB
MSISLRHTLSIAAAVVALAMPASAQQPGSLMDDLRKDVTDVHEKLVGLAKAMPPNQFEWAPGNGVRSVREVFLHVAADNYFMPGMIGVKPDASTGINTSDFKTLTAFEKQKLDQAATIAALDRSFAHLIKVMSETPDTKLADRVKVFGQDMSAQRLWVLTATHLHEHLGQAIAYARMNGVTPPWSK